MVELEKITFYSHRRLDPTDPGGDGRKRQADVGHPCVRGVRVGTSAALGFNRAGLQWSEDSSLDLKK